MTRGDDATFVIVAVDALNKPVNLSGATLRFTAKKSRTDAVPTLSKSTGSGITHTDPANGQAELTFVPADTSSLYAPIALIFDVQLTEGTGKVSTIILGVLQIGADITP
jgi:hypothetical protein